MSEAPSIRRLLLGAFALAVGCYVVGFGVDRQLRTRRGPWSVTFQQGEGGDACLVIQQPRLGIRDVQVSFAGERWTQAPVTVRFEHPRESVPLGRVKYDDLSYLPGVVTLELYGHEIELLPRVLYVDRRAVPWTQATNLVLTAADRQANRPDPARGGPAPDARPVRAAATGRDHP